MRDFKDKGAGELLVSLLPWLTESVMALITTFYLWNCYRGSNKSGYETRGTHILQLECRPSATTDNAEFLTRVLREIRGCHLRGPSVHSQVIGDVVVTTFDGEVD